MLARTPATTEVQATSYARQRYGGRESQTGSKAATQAAQHRRARALQAHAAPSPGPPGTGV